MSWGNDATKDFLQSLRESLERLRTPLDPISIQGTSIGFVNRSPVTGESLFVSPPSDGYNRVSVVTSAPAGINAGMVYRVNGRGAAEVGGWFPTIAGAQGEISNTWETFEIPDRNVCIRFYNSAALGQPAVTAVFWRQY